MDFAFMVAMVAGAGTIAAVFLFMLYKGARKENEDLRAELEVSERARKLLSESLEQFRLIARDRAEIDRRNANAKSDAERIDIIADIVNRNNERVRKREDGTARKTQTGTHPKD